MKNGGTNGKHEHRQKVKQITGARLEALLWQNHLKIAFWDIPERLDRNFRWLARFLNSDHN